MYSLLKTKLKITCTEIDQLQLKIIALHITNLLTIVLWLFSYYKMYWDLHSLLNGYFMAFLTK